MNRTITIKGVGKLSLKPDQTVVSLVLKNVCQNYDAAMAEAANDLNRLREAVFKIGFKKDDLKTTSFDVGAERENERDKNGNYRWRFVGYRVTHALKLEFPFDTKLLSAVLGAIADCIADPELDVRFTVKNREAVNEALLESACRNAKSKAEILTKASGAELGELVSIDYNWGELHFYSPTCYRADDECMIKAASPGSIEIEPDDIDVSDSVTFVWEIK